MGKISGYGVAGGATLSDKLIGTDVSADNETKNFTIAEILGLGSSLYAPINYGSFYDTTTQTVASGSIAAMQFNTTTLSNTVTIVNDGNADPTEITFENAGVYNIQFSAQLQRTTGGADAKITIWLRLNGVDVADSATHITLKANTNYTVAAWNWFQQVAANDNVQIMWSHNDAIQLLYEAADGVLPHPAVPSVILTVNRIA